MNRIVLSCVALALTLGCGAAPAGEKRKLNVLFIVADDLNTDLGCYGHAAVKSPNIDRLAARAVRFQRAYCQYALCAPSRWSFLSGLRPETTGIFEFKTLLRERIADVVFLPQLFRQAGYFTAGMGKVFHDQRQSDARTSWDFYQDRMGDDTQEAAAVKKRYSYAQGKRPFEWTRLDGNGESTRDGLTARGIARFMEEKAKQGKPFFVAAGFHNPHLPWTAPAPFFDRYPPGRIAAPQEPPLRNIPALALLTELSGNPAPRSRAEAMAAYYACVSFMDAQVGVLLDTLDRLQLWDDTIVVLLSDHGYHLGDHDGLWAKLTVFEQAARVPLLIAAPGHGRGRACAGIVELVDLYPTLAEMCGLKAPARLEGQSLVPLLRRSDAPSERAAFIMVQRDGAVGKSVRTQRWRYTEWDEGKKGVELYDHERDPGEYDNVARDPQHAGAIAGLKQLLTSRKAEH
jgi:iduronate 2-sulfatase